MAAPQQAAAVIAIALLAACGGSPPTVTVPDLANRLGCSDLVPLEGTAASFASDGGSCRLYGEQVDLVTFVDNGNRDGWVELGAKLGGVYVVGDGWIAAVADRELAREVQQALGGEIR